MIGEYIAVAILAAGTIPATGFPIVYAFAPWRKSRVGRALMTKAVGIALLIDLSMWGWVTPWDVPDWVVITVFAIVVGGVWMQFLALVRVQLSRSKRYDGIPPYQPKHRADDPPMSDFRPMRGTFDPDER